jgi:protein TonB
MTALAIHLPQRQGLSRWALAALAVLFAHAALVAIIALWYVQRPVEPAILPAIAVSLLPVEASSPEAQNQDIAVGPAMQAAEEARKEPPKEDKPTEKVEQPPIQQPQAEVTLPQVQDKEIEPPKPEVQPPAPETRAPLKTEKLGQFSEAAAKRYAALVFGHMQRFKRYPAAARGATGTVEVRFELDRKGTVIASAVAKSSGNATLDEEALALFKRANPFPPFPPTKPGDRDSFMAPVNFSR